MSRRHALPQTLILTVHHRLQRWSSGGTLSGHVDIGIDQDRLHLVEILRLEPKRQPRRPAAMVTCISGVMSRPLQPSQFFSAI